MRITPVNNVSYKGHLKKTSLITEAIKYAKTEELLQLNNLLDKAKLVNDNKTFIFEGKIKNILNQEYKIISAELFCLSPQKTEKITEIKEKNKTPHNRIIESLNKCLKKIYNS